MKKQLTTLFSVLAFTTSVLAQAQDVKLQPCATYGAMEQAAALGESLAVPGGYDQSGKMTTDPAAILASGRPLPVGFWKGAGLSLLLDLLAAVLSGGDAVKDISVRPDEYKPFPGGLPSIASTPHPMVTVL